VLERNKIDANKLMGRIEGALKDGVDQWTHVGVVITKKEFGEFPPEGMVDGENYIWESTFSGTLLGHTEGPKAIDYSGKYRLGPQIRLLSEVVKEYQGVVAWLPLKEGHRMKAIQNLMQGKILKDFYDEYQPEHYAGILDLLQATHIDALKEFGEFVEAIFESLKKNPEKNVFCSQFAVLIFQAVQLFPTGSEASEAGLEPMTKQPSSFLLNNAFEDKGFVISNNR